MNDSKRKYAVLVSNYPSNEKPNAFGFVHSRIRAYRKLGLEIDVYRISSEKKEYVFEEVFVKCGTKKDISNAIKKENYAAILIHFLDKDKIDIVGDRKCIIWVHGFEALSWKRRLYNMNPKFPLYIYNNTRQLRTFKKYAETHTASKFIFVSDWMYRITSEDIGLDIDNHDIIHNFIDKSIFKYMKKEPELLKRILLIRNFENRKYANDISIKFIKALSKRPYFKNLRIAIYGDGKLFKKTTKDIHEFSNVEINQKFLTQKEISEIQKEFGVFLCPTRQDAQGVSMCEAMSSGLIPITSSNTAIPEFVEDKREGYLCDNRRINSFVECYESLFNNPELFCKMSKLASERIQDQCSFENTIGREVEIIESI